MIPPVDCQDLVEMVTAYLDGAMTPDERAIFEHHLEGCDGCVNYVAQMRTTIELTGSLTRQDIAPETARAMLAAFRNATREPN